VKFKLDENLPELVHTALVGLGHDTHTVAEEQLAGATDAAVIRASTAEGRVLVTLDLDFADIRAYSPGSHAGSGFFAHPFRRFAPLNRSSLLGFASQTQNELTGSCGSSMRSACEFVTPNPSVNPDAPVHTFNLASAGAGAPVTLHRYAPRSRSQSPDLATLTCNYNVVTMSNAEP
jgi:hypothetical protein